MIRSESTSAFGQPRLTKPMRVLTTRGSLYYITWRGIIAWLNTRIEPVLDRMRMLPFWVAVIIRTTMGYFLKLFESLEALKGANSRK